MNIYAMNWWSIWGHPSPKVLTQPPPHVHPRLPHYPYYLVEDEGIKLINYNNNTYNNRTYNKIVQKYF